jgi:ABC-type nitrate/sulfonate/bicarbonate transport system permease component
MLRQSGRGALKVRLDCTPWGVHAAIHLAQQKGWYAAADSTCRPRRSEQQDRTCLIWAGCSKVRALTSFFKVRLPGALPSILTVMKVAISLALGGTIVGKFVESQHGFGYVILSAQGIFDMTWVFAAIFLLAAMGMALYGIVGWLEWRATRWRHVE